MDTKSVTAATKELDELIESFLNEFIEIEYRGVQHVIAKEHYRKVFQEMLPKYLRPAPKAANR